MFGRSFNEAYERALELNDMFFLQREEYFEKIKHENREIKHLVNKINEEKIYILETLIPKYAKNMSVLNRKSIKATLGEEISTEYSISNYELRPIKELLLIDYNEKSIIDNIKRSFIKVFKINKINENLDKEIMEIQAAKDSMKKTLELAMDDKNKLIGIYKLLCSATNLGEAIEQKFRDFIPMIESSKLIYGDCNIEKRSYRIGRLLKCYEGVTLFLVKVCETKYRVNSAERIKYVSNSLIEEQMQELDYWKEVFKEI